MMIPLAFGTLSGAAGTMHDVMAMSAAAGCFDVPLPSDADVEAQLAAIVVSMKKVTPATRVMRFIPSDPILG
jgi:hypothetical protein